MLNFYNMSNIKNFFMKKIINTAYAVGLPVLKSICAEVWTVIEVIAVIVSNFFAAIFQPAALMLTAYSLGMLTAVIGVCIAVEKWYLAHITTHIETILDIRLDESKYALSLLWQRYQDVFPNLSNLQLVGLLILGMIILDILMRPVSMWLSFICRTVKREPIGLWSMKTKGMALMMYADFNRYIMRLENLAIDVAIGTCAFLFVRSFF